MDFKLTPKQMIHLCGGPAKIARRFKVTTQAVHRWQNEGLPASKLMELAAQIERESHGLVTRKDMFPQSWHLIWPELATEKN